jgi:hypothetical protein
VVGVVQAIWLDPLPANTRSTKSAAATYLMVRSSRKGNRFSVLSANPGPWLQGSRLCFQGKGLLWDTTLIKM